MSKSGEERPPVHLSATNRDLLTPGARHFGAFCVIDMHLPDPRCEHMQCLHRITLVVHDHVGRVEIHADVRVVQFVKQIGEGRRGFLSGFKPEQDVLHHENVSHDIEAFDHFCESGVGFVGRQKAGVESDEF